MAQEAVRNALIINNRMPAVHLAEVMLRDLDRDIAGSLSEILMRRFFVHAIHTERRKENATKRHQELLPGFEHLPIRIPTVSGGRIRLLNADYTALRTYYRTLMARQRERQKEDPRIKELRELMARMRKRIRTDKRITVKEMLMWE